MATPAPAIRQTDQDEPEELSEPAQFETWEIATASARLATSAPAELSTEMRHAREALEAGDEAIEELYSPETLLRAEAFLKAQIEWLWRSCGIKAAIPSVGPGPAGSVDLYWKEQDWELLVNIPPFGQLATFYGENYGSEKNKGSFEPEKLSTNIVAWLMR